MAMILSSHNYEYFYWLLEYENSVMKGVCNKWEKDKEFMYQTLLEGSHTISLVFLFVIHTIWQGCKGIYDTLYGIH